MFLYLDEENTVRVKPTALEIPEVKILYSSDRRPDGNKPFFHKAIKFIFHAYSKELSKGVQHPFINLAEKERINEVKRIYFNDENINDIIENKKVIDVKNVFIKYSYSTLEKYYESVKNNIETWTNHISEIPLTIRKQIQQKVTVFTGEGESRQEHEVYVKDYIYIDNSDEMIKATKNGSELIKIEEEIKKRVIKENAQKEISAEESLLDTGELDFNIKTS